MTAGKTYKITKRIKIHTKPICTVEVIQTGVFVKETEKYYVFNGFRVRKDVVTVIKQIKNIRG